MRALIDASPLLLRSAGVKNYLYYWLKHVRLQAGDDRVDAYPWLGEPGPLTHERSVLPAGATIARVALLHFFNIRFNPLINTVAGRYDVVHVTNQLRHPIRGARVTATVHDMTATMMPELHTAGNVKADARFSEQVLRRADGLIAVSESTRGDAVRLLGIPPEKVVVIHPGVDERFAGVDAEAAVETARRLGLAKPYVLCLGTVEPRKNIGRLLEAWNMLPASAREAFELVVAGPAGWAARDTLARLESGEPGVRWLGYVAENDLPGLTAAAAVFAYPSLYEGFGFPVAQAMAAGVPVVTSNVSSLPEVAGGAALLVDPRSPAEIRGALEELLTSEALRARLGAAGRERAARMFRWDECARRSLEFLRKVASSSRMG